LIPLVFIYLFFMSAKSEEHVDYIPGISSIQLGDIPFDWRNQQTMQMILEVFSWVNKAQYLLLTSIYELESKVFDVLKAKFSFPVYAMGQIVPNFDFGENTNHNDNNYLHWLDCNLEVPFYIFEWEVFIQFLLPKWMKLHLVCVIVVLDSFGWHVTRLTD